MILCTSVSSGLHSALTTDHNLNHNCKNFKCRESDGTHQACHSRPCLPMSLVSPHYSSNRPNVKHCPTPYLSVGTSLEVRLDSSLPTLFRLLQLASRCLRSSHCARTSSCTLRFNSWTRFRSSSITWLPIRNMPA